MDGPGAYAVSGGDIKRVTGGPSIGQEARPSTLVDVVDRAEELLKLQAELGSRLNRIADMLGGPEPQTGERADRPSEQCLPDALHRRLSDAIVALHGLHNLVGRIERRIG